ncbi:MAG TPA: hypothetical protein VKN14_10155 [Flavobacteriaceae bacterium]|nr:hypothetical protein [Flavobacteriaceae bacterium]
MDKRLQEILDNYSGKERYGFEEAKKELLDLFGINHSAIDHLKKIVRIYEMGKAGTSAIFAQGQAMDGYTQLYNYNDLADKAKKIVDHCG